MRYKVSGALVIPQSLGRCAPSLAEPDSVVFFRSNVSCGTLHESNIEIQGNIRAADEIKLQQLKILPRCMSSPHLRSKLNCTN